MDRSRFSTHKRPAFLLAGVLLALLGIFGAWHVLSRQAQWTVLDQAALENAGDAHLRSLSQQAEQCAGTHDFLWTGEVVELTNPLSSEAHAFLPVCAISPADVPKYGDAAWEIEFLLLTTWDGGERPAWVPKLSVSQWELELDPGINTGLTGPDWHSEGGARWYALTQADASLWQEAQNGTPTSVTASRPLPWTLTGRTMRPPPAPCLSPSPWRAADRPRPTSAVSPSIISPTPYDATGPDGFSPIRALKKYLENPLQSGFGYGIVRK